MTLHLSPLLPDQPDWQELAGECSRAYFALRRIEDAVNRRDVSVDGMSFWNAHNRLEKAASVIASWGADPELYGRLIARERIIRAFEAEDAICEPCRVLVHTQCSPVASCACPHRAALEAQKQCANVVANTPHADCCEQCRYELGL